MSIEFLLLSIFAVCLSIFVVLIWLVFYVYSIYHYITGEGEQRVIAAIIASVKRKISGNDSATYHRDPYLEAFEGDADESKRINTVRGSK